MTIHSEHPFMAAEPERSPVRRLRGRLPSPVTLWTAGGAPAKTGGAPAKTGGAPANAGGAPAKTGGAPARTASEGRAAGGEVPRAGLTVSSVLIADGEPGQILGIIDPLSDLWDALIASSLAVVSILDWRHRQLADQFGYVAPAPGGPFRSAQWQQTEWGPALVDATAWAGCRLADTTPPRQVGWGMLVQLDIAQVHLAEDEAWPLVHRRGRYLPPDRSTGRPHDPTEPS